MGAIEPAKSDHPLGRMSLVAGRTTQTTGTQNPTRNPRNVTQSYAELRSFTQSYADLRRVTQTYAELRRPTQSNACVNNGHSRVLRHVAPLVGRVKDRRHSQEEE